MRRILLIASLGLAPFMAQTQQLPAQTPAPVWHFDDMNSTAVVLIFKEDSARVQKDSAHLVFAIQQQGAAIRLKNKETDTRALQLLGLSAEAVNIQYGADSIHLLPTEKLLTAASRLPERKLLLEGKNIHPAALHTPDAGHTPVLAEEEPAGASRHPLSTDQPWLYAAIALVLGLIIGWLIKPNRKSKEETVPDRLSKEEAAPSVPDAALQQEIAQLQQQLSLGQQELSRLKQEDQHFYTATFEQLLLPIQESLDQNKKSHLVAQLVTAAVLLNSLTRHKLGKKGKYDDANLNLLIGAPAAASEAPLITGATPPDQIPHHLRGLIELLHEYGISGLGDLVVQGYRIKDL